MQYIDKEFINKISIRLEGFYWKNNNVANFRCPVCGDSKKKKSKKRGYFFPKKNFYSFYCHNCHRSQHFKNFLKEFDSELYKEYVKKSFGNKNTGRGGVSKRELNETLKFRYFEKLNLPSLFELNEKSEIRKYVESRKILKQYWQKIFYCDDLKKLIYEVCKGDIPDEYKNIYGNSHLIFPLYNFERKIFAFSARKVMGNGPKYLNLKFNDKYELVYGIERWNASEITYITEGPIDSLFLPNSLAFCGSSFMTFDFLERLNSERTIFILDNEPRNSNIISSMKKILSKGWKLFIWPENVTENDINDYVINNDTFSLIRMINENIFFGMNGKMRLNKWKKV